MIEINIAPIQHTFKTPVENLMGPRSAGKQNLLVLDIAPTIGRQFS